MVQIVGRDEALVKRVSCKGCASILEYHEGEVKRGKFNCDYLGDCDVWSYIDCPKCNQRVVVRTY
jgi:primosomal protein N'